MCVCVCVHVRVCKQLPSNQGFDRLISAQEKRVVVSEGWGNGSGLGPLGHTSCGPLLMLSCNIYSVRVCVCLGMRACVCVPVCFSSITTGYVNNEVALIFAF